MDESTKHSIQRLIRRIPIKMLKLTLEKWGRLTDTQQQSMDFTQPKRVLSERLLSIFEENEWTVKHITELEMIYIMENPKQRMWNAFQLTDPEDDFQSVELLKFKEQFKSHLGELTGHVSVKIKKHTDEAVWIRIAWGDGLSRPNHLKPTYVVHHLQTPYVYVTALTSKQKPLLTQALLLATRYQALNNASLSGRNLCDLRDLVMRQYQQVFPAKCPSPLAEKIETASSTHTMREHEVSAANRHQMASEAFGDGKLPQLQSAVYKLETRFKDNTNNAMSEWEEPVRCVVKFTSTNLLESFRHCASLGIASTPVTPILTSIPQRARNYFVITDNVPGPSSQK